MSPSLRTTDTRNNTNSDHTMISLNARNIRERTALTMPLAATRLNATRAAKTLSASTLDTNLTNKLSDLTRDTARNGTTLRLLNSELDGRINIRLKTLSLSGISKRLTLKSTDGLLRLNTRNVSLNALLASSGTKTDNRSSSLRLITDTLSLGTKSDYTKGALLRMLTSLRVIARNLDMVLLYRPTKTPILNSTGARTNKMSFLARATLHLLSEDGSSNSIKDALRGTEDKALNTKASTLGHQALIGVNDNSGRIINARAIIILNIHGNKARGLLSVRNSNTITRIRSIRNLDGELTTSRVSRRTNLTKKGARMLDSNTGLNNLDFGELDYRLQLAPCLTL